MKIETHLINNIKLAEIISADIFFKICQRD